MKRTLAQQAGANIRASVFLVVIMALLLATLGGGAVMAFAKEYWWIGALVGLVVTALTATVGWIEGRDWVVDAIGARMAKLPEHQQLLNIVEEVAVAAGIPSPTVFVVDDRSPNAFATGNGPKDGVIVVTQGLLDALDRDELQAVIAHEVAHIVRQDVRFLTMVVLVAGIVPFLCDVLRAILWGDLGSAFDSEELWILIIGSLAILFLWILSPLFTVFLRVAVGRRREFLADATAVELTRNPDALASALQKLSRSPGTKTSNRATQPMYIVDPEGSRGSDLFSTHPSVQERIRAIRSLMGTGPTIVLGQEAERL